MPCYKKLTISMPFLLCSNSGDLHFCYIFLSRSINNNEELENMQIKGQGRRQSAFYWVLYFEGLELEWKLHYE